MNLLPFFSVHAEVVIIDRSLHFHPVTNDNEGSASGTMSFLFSSPEQQPTIFIDSKAPVSLLMQQNVCFVGMQ